MSQVTVHIVARDPITLVGLTTNVDRHPETVSINRDAGMPEVVLYVATALTHDGDARGLRESAQLAQGVLIAEVSKELPLLTLVECGVVGIFDRAEATPERVSGTVVAAGVGKGVRSGDRLGRLVELVRRTQRDVLAPLGMNTAGFSDREVNVLRLVADGAYTSEIARELSCSESTVKQVLQTLTTD